MRAVAGPDSRHAALIEDAFHVLVETPGGGVSLQRRRQGPRARAKRAVETIAERADAGAGGRRGRRARGHRRSARRDRRRRGARPAARPARRGRPPRPPPRRAIWSCWPATTWCSALGPAGTGKTFLAVAHGAGLLLLGRGRPAGRHPPGGGGRRAAGLPARRPDREGRSLHGAGLGGADRHPGRRASCAAAATRGEIEVAPIAFMRGRTLSHAFVIVDEAQNTSRLQMKMVLTRLGEGARMAVTGDPSQVDLLNPRDSGLAHAVAHPGGRQGRGRARFARRGRGAPPAGRADRQGLRRRRRTRPRPRRAKTTARRNIISSPLVGAGTLILPPMRPDPVGAGSRPTAEDGHGSKPAIGSGATRFGPTRRAHGALDPPRKNLTAASRASGTRGPLPPQGEGYVCFRPPGARAAARPRPGLRTGGRRRSAWPGSGRRPRPSPPRHARAAHWRSPRGSAWRAAPALPFELADGADRRDAVHHRHLQIHQDGVEPARREGVHGLAPVLDRDQLDRRPGEHQRNHLPVGRVIVREQDPQTGPLGDGSAARAASGAPPPPRLAGAGGRRKVRVKVAPAPRAPCASSRPPISSAIWREIARPRPVPPNRRVSVPSACSKRSKMRSRSSSREPDAGVRDREAPAAPPLFRRGGVFGSHV